MQSRSVSGAMMRDVSPMRTANSVIRFVSHWFSLPVNFYRGAADSDASELCAAYQLLLKTKYRVNTRRCSSSSAGRLSPSLFFFSPTELSAKSFVLFFDYPCN